MSLKRRVAALEAVVAAREAAAPGCDAEYLRRSLGAFGDALPEVMSDAGMEVDVELMGAFGRLPVDEMVALALLAELSACGEAREPITPAVIGDAARGRARLVDALGVERVVVYFPEVSDAKCGKRAR